MEVPSIFKNDETVIAQGLRIEGKVTAEGLVKVHGTIEGDLHCTSLVIAETAQINGTVIADKIVVNGRVAGPIRSHDVVLKSQADVTGDIYHKSLIIEKGAHFEGRSKQKIKKAAADTTKKSTTKKKVEPASNDNIALAS